MLLAELAAKARYFTSWQLFAAIKQRGQGKSHAEAA